MSTLMVMAPTAEAPSPAVNTLGICTPRRGDVWCGSPVPVRGQAPGQCRQHRLGGFVGGVVTALREDETLHVVGCELHRCADRCAHVLRSSDHQDGEGQPSSTTLLVLGEGCVECAVELEAAAQGFRAGGEGVDVRWTAQSGSGLAAFVANWWPK